MAMVSCQKGPTPWWRDQIEIFSALLAICAGNSPVPGEFPTQRPVTRSFDVYFDLRPNKRLCKQSWGWWFETLLCPLWRHSNAPCLRIADRAIVAGCPRCSDLPSMLQQKPWQRHWRTAAEPQVHIRYPWFGGQQHCRNEYNSGWTGFHDFRCIGI